MSSLAEKIPPVPKWPDERPDEPDEIPPEEAIPVEAPTTEAPGRLDSEALAALRPRMFTAAELQTKTFAPRVAYIDGLILEGLTIFGGKPKLGKSWWALRAALTIATGGVAFGSQGRDVRPAKVLYLALEDGEARLQDRMTQLCGPGEAWPNEMTVITVWPRFDAGGIDLLAELVDADGYEVVIIDTLGRVRTPRKGRDTYQEDTDALSAIHDMVRERPGLAVVLIHHNRKDDSPDDYIDALSGTTGVSGAVDHIAVLQRGRGQADAVLRFTSRDATEHDTAYAFAEGQWTELGSAVEYEMSKARRAVLEAVTSMESATLTEIALEVRRDISLTRRMLIGLAEERLVYQDGERGPWKPRPNSPIVQPGHPQSGLLDQLDRVF